MRLLFAVVRSSLLGIVSVSEDSRPERVYSGRLDGWYEPVRAASQQRLLPDPFRYEPERWPIFTEASEDGQSGLQRLFSGPARLCENLVITAVLLTVATVMWLVDFRAAEGEVKRLVEGGPHLGHRRHRGEDFQLYDGFTLHEDGAVLQFKQRHVEGEGKA